MITIKKGKYNVDSQKLSVIAENLADKLNLSGDITIKIGNKDESKELNLKFRKKDYPTDVLSFPFNEKMEDSYYIGDIFICYPIAEAQSIENSISIFRELTTLTVHGILHLAGYDHETDSGEMLNFQNEFLSGLDI